MIFQILAVSKNGVIGCDNEMPWRLPADMAYFKKMTFGHPVIMGRKTWDSLGKPLKGRKNVVVTRNPKNIAFDQDSTDDHTTVVICETLQQAIDTVGNEDSFIIGGGEIYRQSTDLCDRVYLTYINGEFQGDSFYDMDKLMGFELISDIKGIRDDKNQYDYSFKTYQRKL